MGVGSICQSHSHGIRRLRWTAYSKHTTQHSSTAHQLQTLTPRGSFLQHARRRSQHTQHASLFTNISYAGPQPGISVTLHCHSELWVDGDLSASKQFSLAQLINRWSIDSQITSLRASLLCNTSDHLHAHTAHVSLHQAIASWVLARGHQSPFTGIQRLWDGLLKAHNTTLLSHSISIAGR